MMVTISTVRAALRELGVQIAKEMPDEALKNADFQIDLGLNEQDVCSMMSLLEKRLRIGLPPIVLDSLRAKNTVAVFITAANHHLIDLLERYY